ncbi:MAG TPA: hypothetical protein ENK88_00285 [Campylobacterales bacterium]|nr:hypothetical protein [Campylobacterales bacterium]
MSNSSLVTIIKGYEPFDLLRLSKDAFYDVVGEKFPKIDISDMKLSFVFINDEISIRAEITDYKVV